MSGADTRPDDFEPADLPAKARAAYGDKLALGTGQTLALAVMAGAFIAFGSVFFLIVQSVPDTMPYGFVQALSGAAFALGLILLAKADDRAHGLSVKAGALHFSKDILDIV